MNTSNIKKIYVRRQSIDAVLTVTTKEVKSNTNKRTGTLPQHCIDVDSSMPEPIHTEMYLYYIQHTQVLCIIFVYQFLAFYQFQPVHK